MPSIPSILVTTLSSMLVASTLYGCGDDADANSNNAHPDAAEEPDSGANPGGDGGTTEPVADGAVSNPPHADAATDNPSPTPHGEDAGGGNGDPTAESDAGGGNGDPTPEGDAGGDPIDPSSGDGGSQTPSAEAASYFLPTTEPDNTAAPRIELDAQGGIHALYPAYVGGGAYYAYCPENCNTSADFKVAYLPTDGTVGNAMLALTDTGAPRVLLSTYLDASYATCDEDCTEADSWHSDVILTHNSDKEITGEALALDPAGHPHFTIHTYRALFGIGQLPPKTEYASCIGADCTKASAWKYTPVSDQIWESAQLKFSADGAAHLAFVADVMEDNVVTNYITAYSTCEGECLTLEDWPATGLANAYADNTEAVAIKPSVSLALTQSGKPRILAFAKSDEGEKNLDYFECDDDCTSDGFLGTVLSNHPDLGEGIDLALDAQDRPRFVHTLDYNIALAYCDTLPCAASDSHWDLTMVEASSSIPKDNIFPYPNCYIGAWFLHSPSISIAADGAPRVGYQARDISGGFGLPDGPDTAECVAGTDMTWSRLSVMTSYKE